MDQNKLNIEWLKDEYRAAKLLLDIDPKNAMMGAYKEQVARRLRKNGVKPSKIK